MLADAAWALRLTAVMEREPSLATNAVKLVALWLMATPMGRRMVAGDPRWSVDVWRAMKARAAVEPTAVIAPLETLSRKSASAPSDAT